MRLTAVSIVLFMLIYPAAVWLVARAMPLHGDPAAVRMNGAIVGFEKQGQRFAQDKYFQSRPSAVNYNAAGSGGSNKGASNPDYLQDVRNRIDSFLKHNPGVLKSDIPSDLVTASGSGLDPDISLQAARIQRLRIARIRAIPLAAVDSLIAAHTIQGANGIQRVNVLRINVALDSNASAASKR